MNEPGGRFDEATLATLEFPDVIDQIAAKTTCEPGAVAVRALRPLADRRAAEADLALVDDASALFDAGADFGFGGVVDVSDALDRAAVGSTLSGQELRDIARSERALAAAVKMIEDAQRRSSSNENRSSKLDRSMSMGSMSMGSMPVGLGSLVSAQNNTSHVVRRLDEAVDEDGVLNDGASAELARLRRQQRQLAEEIRRRVDDIVRKPATAKLLSEEIVTVRGGRYVVPVRAEFAAQLPGVVHSQSASGATVFIEPMACVEANNRLRGLEAAEEREIQRILAELSKMVAAEAAAIGVNAALLARLDAIAARARWSKSKGAIPPALVDTQSMRIVRGRHPLLRRAAVPLDVDVGIDADALVISGPNMGGKTVVLKTIGLFCLLAYAGVPLPAGPGTEIGAFDHIACIVGDEQSIANDLSSFSAHLRALHAALARAGPRSLVLVDEIGNGTEPGAGAALAQAFVEALLAKGARVVVTTHFTQLKVFAASRERVENASMLFDAATHDPTYLLAMGVPGQSLAFALARTIGFDDHAIARAEALLGSDAQNLERAFEGLALERERLRAQEAQVESEIQRLRSEENALREKLAQAQTERAKFQAEAAEALDRAVRRTREELLAKAERSEQDARRQRARAAEGSAQSIRSAMIDIRRSLGLEESSPSEPAANAYAVGDRVYVRSFGQPGVISEVYDRDVLVTMGSVKAVVARRDITRDPAAMQGEKTPKPAARGPARIASLDASTSIDVRGMRVDEAMPIVDKALDDASLAGLPALRVIHGKGTGQLGRGIRDFLKGHAQVDSMQFAPDREGGTGVTVITLR